MLRLFLLLFMINHQIGLSSTLVVGDLEGDYGKFERYLKEHSEYFAYESDVGWKILGDHQFVFMGDAVDKGAGGIRIVEALSKLKKANPEQVTLLLGNRDVNKLLVYNLINDSRSQPPREALRRHYISYLNGQGMKLEPDMPLSKLHRIVAPIDDETLRLKVVLNSMNAANAFEYIREELATISGKSFISDGQVYRHFMDSIEKGGAFYEYLKMGDVVKIIDGTLYTHGGVSNENIGKIPGRATRITDLNQWSERLNKWAKREIISWGEDHKKGKALLRYHAPRITGKNVKESVFYHRYSDSLGNPKMPAKSLIKKFRSSGVHRAVVAHTPIGEVPTSVKTHGFEFIMSDVSNSHSRDLPVIKVDRESTLIRSYLADGEEVFSKTFSERNILPDGFLTTDGYRIVGQKKDTYLLLKFKTKGGEYIPTYIERSLGEIYRIGLKSLREKSFRACAEVFQ